jgi:hypothetical protein
LFRVIGNTILMENWSVVRLTAGAPGGRRLPSESDVCARQRGCHFFHYGAVLRMETMESMETMRRRLARMEPAVDARGGAHCARRLG